MKTTSINLIDDLITRTQANLVTAQNLKSQDLASMQFKASPASWSALECIDHINLYAAIYISNLTAGMQQSSIKPQEEFKSKRLGNWFAKMMQPGNAGTKMKTFKSKNPNGKHIPLSVIDKLINDQHTLLELLETAKTKNLKKTKVATDFGSWLSLNLGDSLRIIIYHNQRHLEQAQRSLSAYTAMQTALV